MLYDSFAEYLLKIHISAILRKLLDFVSLLRRWEVTDSLEVNAVHQGCCSIDLQCSEHSGPCDQLP
jgi:hypothetical protein